MDPLINIHDNNYAIFKHRKKYLSSNRSCSPGNWGWASPSHLIDNPNIAVLAEGEKMVLNKD